MEEITKRAWLAFAFAWFFQCRCHWPDTCDVSPITQGAGQGLDFTGSRAWNQLLARTVALDGQLHS